MKNKYLFIIIFFTNIGGYAQTFTAETGYLYLGEKDIELSGGMEIKSGIVKKNDKIDIYAPTGRKFTATITKISGKENQEVAQIKAGEYGYFDFRFTEILQKEVTTSQKAIRSIPLVFR